MINQYGKIFDVRSEDGIVDSVTDDGAIIRTQDVTGILEANRIERNADSMHGFRIAPWARRVASIPVTVIDLYAKKGIDLLHDKAAMRQFLNDPQNRAFRTTTERV